MNNIQRAGTLGLLAVLISLPLVAFEAVGAFENHSDAGITPRAGSAQFDSGASEYRVSGGRANIWGTADAFHSDWKRVSGDITFTTDASTAGRICWPGS